MEIVWESDGEFGNGGTLGAKLEDEEAVGWGEVGDGDWLPFDRPLGFLA